MKFILTLETASLALPVPTDTTNQCEVSVVKASNFKRVAKNRIHHKLFFERYREQPNEHRFFPRQSSTH